MVRNVLVGALLLGACTATGEPGGPSESPSETSTATPRATAGPTDAGTPTSGPDDGSVAVTWERVGDGFDNPVQVLNDPVNGATLVVEQAGRITTLDGTVVLDISARVDAGGERGLLGADVLEEDLLLVHFSDRADGATVLAQVPRIDGAWSADELTVLLTVDQPARNHNGGSVLVHPDGTVFLALGDGGASDDRFGNGQRPDTLLGTLLRLAVAGGVTGPAPGNPFVGRADGAPEVWAYGLRNPYRIWLDDGRVYVADVGQDAVEEVSVIDDDQAGANFGWPLFEGSECRVDDCDVPGLVEPVAELRHDTDGVCSIIGGVVVRDAALPALEGVYLYSDLCAPRLHGLRVGASGAAAHVEFAGEGATVPGPPLGFGLDADGRVLVGTADGTVHRLVPAG